MSNLTFYTNPMSRGRIARWMLEETGAPYDTEVVGYGPDMNAPDYRALNPMAKVPTLRHGDVVVTEVAAICCYLADAFPDADLAPAPGAPERGAYYRWMFFGAGPIEQAVVNASFGWTTDDPREQGRTGYGSLDRVARTLDAHLSDGRSFMLGETFSAVDVYVGSQIAWGLQFKTLPHTDSFAAYTARLMGRPAALRAREKDDALLPPES